MNLCDLETLVDELRAAGEPTRARVLVLLGQGELSVGELAQILGQSQPRLSRHMKFLTAAGLVERMPEGAWVFYRLAPSGRARVLVDAILSLLDRQDQGVRRDLMRLEEVRATRRESAVAYFERTASDWDAIRALHYPESDIEAAILAVAGKGPFAHVVDMGTGTGRMLNLLAPYARQAEGIDLSHQMLTVARANLSSSGHSHVAVRHGDATAAPFEDNSADLVIIHQVLHFLEEPGRAIQEAARILAPRGRMIVVDFAPHELEHLRRDQAHRHLGIADRYFADWCEKAGLKPGPVERFAPPQDKPGGLAVNVWTADAGEEKTALSADNKDKVA